MLGLIAFGKVLLYFVPLLLGLFCFSSLPVELFDCRVLNLPVVEESISYLTFICRNWFVL